MYHFVGLDFNSIMSLAPKLAEQNDVARKAKIIAYSIRHYQESLSSIERCEKPVIAAVHSACVGGGVDMITATDIRYCTTDAWFQVKEVFLIHFIIICYCVFHLTTINIKIWMGSLITL